LGLGFIQKYIKKIKKAIETKMFKSYNTLWEVREGGSNGGSCCTVVIEDGLR